ncbi:MAG: GtrA family protein [Rickettsiaceae bacterium]|nr:GtrA family protein [Rickettsiaceae bacterium]
MLLDLLRHGVSKQFYRFIVVGVWSTIINYGIFIALLELMDINYLLASAMGFISGVFAGYGFNRKWTFKVEAKKGNAEIIKYYIVYSASLVLSLAFLHGVVDVLGLDPKIANILAVGLTTCTNFIGIKIMVFK